MILENLRNKALYQNTIDIWIALCSERNIDWYAIDNYKKFINYLLKFEFNMKKFPLCIKETGGVYERSKDKTQFAEHLSQFNTIDSMAYTIKLNDDNIIFIRKFKL